MKSDYPIQAKIIQDVDGKRLEIAAPKTQEELELWRKIYHDHLAAMRSLRYLAQKGLQNPQDTPEQLKLKQASLDRHLAQLERFDSHIVQPILQELPRSLADDSP